jgi:hypothetical protein
VLTPSDAGTSDYFGNAVALSGTTLAVGAYGWDGLAGTNQGGVYIYDWSGSAWVQRGDVLTASDAESGDYYGWAVALDGTTLVVGTHLWDGPAGGDQGAVYIYDWSGSAWVQRGGVLTASDAAAGNYFGSAVALADTALVVGSRNRNGSAGTNQGGVYIYDWSGSAWVQRGDVLTPSDAGGADYFGWDLSFDGETLVVAAYGWDGPGGSGQGAVYIYDWSGSAWVQRGDVLTASDAGVGDQFGIGVAIDGDTLIAGARGWDGPAGDDQGAVYTYALSPHALPLTQTSSGLVPTTDGLELRVDGSRSMLVDDTGFVLTSPDGTEYKVTVSDAGALTVTAV